MIRNVAKIPSDIINKIPYIRVYEDEGIFEIKPMVFSKTYKLDFSITNENKADMAIVGKRFVSLLDSFEKDVQFEFTIHNRYIEENEYLKNILLRPTNTNKVKDTFIDNYNYLIADNINIGHNNVDKDKYFTITIQRDIAEEAKEKFQELDIKIKSLFYGICEIEAVPLTTIERLEILYNIYNRNTAEKFGSKVDIENNGIFTFKNMKYMKISTKDVIGPTSFTQSKDYFVLNKKEYGRSFFINTLPSIISNNLITDLTNISSNMLFSIHYEAIDAKEGFDVAASLVGKNTVINETFDRRTVLARKKKKTIKTFSTINNSEKDYFNKVSLETFKEAVAKQQKVFVCTVVITLFANSLEDLDRDSNLLKLSASKFVTQIKTLDLQQIAGFNTSLPLGNISISARRVFNLDKIGALIPLDIQATMKKDGQFMGLNAMNDNLILINRKNNINTNGIIAGVKYSGKTFQVKRELVNAYMSTNDKIVIISTKNGDYETLVNKLNGKEVALDKKMNVFFTDDDYGLMEDKKIFKASFLKALLAEYREIYANYKDELEKIETLQEWNNEEEEFERYLFACNCNTTLEKMIEKMRNCPRIMDNLRKLEKDLNELKEEEESVIDYSQVNLYHADSARQLLIIIDRVWNQVLEDKKKNITTWIFIDAIDELLMQVEIGDYLQEFVVKCKQSKTVLTMVVQESVKIFNDYATTYELLLDEIGYVKLLNQAPIERSHYAEILNIPNGLINYITNVEPGEGIIITPISNIVFDDSFVEDKTRGFYGLFFDQKDK